MADPARAIISGREAADIGLVSEAARLLGEKAGTTVRPGADPLNVVDVAV